MRKSRRTNKSQSSGDEVIKPEHRRETLTPVKPLNKKQGEYLRAMNLATVTFGIGPSGVGKTWLAGNWACEQLLAGNFEKILVTRPAVEAGEKLGFLPGTLGEKHGPYLTPLMEVIKDRIGEGKLTGLMKSGHIEATPVAFLRGRSLKHTLLWIDEAQNLTPAQVKMLLTRIGEGSKVIIDGDPRQKDIPGISGLMDAVEKIGDLPDVRVIEFTKDDIVRSGIVQQIVERYEN